MNFLMVIMASGIARGRVRTTTTTTESRKMAAILQVMEVDRDIGYCRNVRGLGKSMVVFRLFEKLRCSNQRSTKFESLYHE